MHDQELVETRYDPLWGTMLIVMTYSAGQY